MAIDATISTKLARESTGDLIGYVLDRLAIIHAAPEIDQVAAIAKHAELLHWTDGAIKRASCRLSDRDCLEAYELLTSIRRRLREQSHSTPEWLKSTVRSVDVDFSDRLRQLADALYPVAARCPDYDPDDCRHSEAPSPTRGAVPDSLESQRTFLDLIVDEQHGEVTRAGHKYKDPSRHAGFRLGSAEWQLFITAFRAGSPGVSRVRVLSRYPGNKRAAAVRQAKLRANEKLSRLNVALAEGWPLCLVHRDGA